MYQSMDVLCFISYVLSNVTMYTCLKIIFGCRNNASEETYHQEISKSAKATGTRGGRRFLPSGCKTIGILSKIGARHQNNHQEGFHSASGLWRHRGEHRDQNSIPALGRTFQENQAGGIPRIYPTQRSRYEETR
jgi:hypothetical protein